MTLWLSRGLQRTIIQQCITGFTATSSVVTIDSSFTTLTLPHPTYLLSLVKPGFSFEAANWPCSAPQGRQRRRDLRGDKTKK